MGIESPRQYIDRGIQYIKDHVLPTSLTPSGSLRWAVLGAGAIHSLLTPACAPVETTPNSVAQTQTPASLPETNTVVPTATLPLPTNTLRPALQSLPEVTPTPYVSPITKEQRNLGLKIRQDVIDKVHKFITPKYYDEMVVDEFSHKLSQASLDGNDEIIDQQAIHWLDQLNPDKNNEIKGVLSTRRGDNFLTIAVRMNYGPELTQTSQPIRIVYFTKLDITTYPVKHTKDADGRASFVDLPNIFTDLFILPSDQGWTPVKTSSGKTIGLTSTQTDSAGYKYTAEINYYGELRYTIEKTPISQVAKKN